MFDIDERFEKMNARDTDQGGCMCNLDGAWIDMSQPIWSIATPRWI